MCDAAPALGVQSFPHLPYACVWHQPAPRPPRHPAMPGRGLGVPGGILASVESSPGLPLSPIPAAVPLRARGGAVGNPAQGGIGEASGLLLRHPANPILCSAAQPPKPPPEVGVWVSQKAAWALGDSDLPLPSPLTPIAFRKLCSSELRPNLLSFTRGDSGTRGRQGSGK